MNLQATLTYSFFLKKVFLTALFMLIFISAITYRYTIAFSESTKLVIHSQQIHLKIEQLISYLKDAETGQRGYIITRNPVYLHSFIGSREKINEFFKALKLLINDNLKQQNNLDSLNKLINSRYLFFYGFLEQSSKKPYDNDQLNILLLKDKMVMDKIRLKVNEMIDLETVFLKERNTNYDNEISYTPIFTLLFFLFMILVFVISYLMINRDLKNVKKANEDLIIVNESINHAEIMGDFCSTQWDVNLNKLVYSDNLYRLLGCEPQSFEPTVENYLKFVYPDDRHIVENVSINIINKKEETLLFYRIIRTDGAVRYFKSIGKMISNSENHKTYIGMTNDVTESYLGNIELEKRNIELEKSNAELLITTESINHAEEIGEFSTWRWDFETNTLKYSDNQYRLLGCEPQSFEATIKNYLEFVHPEDRHIVTEGGKNMLNNIGIPSTFFRIIRKDRQVRYIKSIAKSLIDVNGKSTLIGINADITDQYLNSLTLENKNQELMQSNTELASFNHIASHDLQEPLRKIQLFISRIEENEQKTMSEIGKEYFSRIHLSAQRMRVLIDDLLLFSRTNKAEKVFEKVDLTLLLKNAKRELMETINEKKAVIIFSQLPVLSVIPFQIQQLFINLISNSLKYSNTEIPPIIEISCEKITENKNKILRLLQMEGNKILQINSDNIYYKFVFRDNGIGFDQKNVENIFILFQRLHHKTEYSGTGIGLAICKKIVENHAGFITAEGRPDKGATFTFFLPE